MRALALTPLVLLLLAAPARAALTESEKAQIKGYVRDGDAGKAQRVRSLVARPDLTPEEAAEPLVLGYTHVPFDEKRERFTRALLSGPGSEASRSAIAVPVIKGLLARATEALAQLPTLRSASFGDKAVLTADEIVRIHRFVSVQIANAGKPPPDGHDPGAAIRDDALVEAARTYARHLEENQKWLRQGGVAEGALTRVRAQAQLTTIDLGRGLFPRHEVARWLGLDGARAGLFQRKGVLLEDAGTGSEERVAEAVRLFESAPAAADGVSSWLIDKAPPGDLVARGEIARARALLGAAPAPDGGQTLFPDDIEPPKLDRTSIEMAHSVAWLAARHALASRPDLARRAQALAERIGKAGARALLGRELAGTPLEAEGAAATIAPSAEQVLAHALVALLLDAPRALDLVLLRISQGRPEPAAALALGLGALSVGAGEAPTELELGRAGAGGRVEPLAVTKLELQDGGAKSFVADGKTYRIQLGTDGMPAAVQVDGATPVVAKLTYVRQKESAAGALEAHGVSYARLFGEPEGVALDDGRFVVAAGSKGGFDALSSGAEASEMKVGATLRPLAAGGGLLAVARGGESSYAGIALFVGTKPWRALLVSVDGRGKAVELAPALELPEPKGDGYRVTLEVAGAEVKAEIDGKKLGATLDAMPEPGRAGLTVRPDGKLEVRSFVVGAPGEKADSKKSEKKEKKRGSKK